MGTRAHWFTSRYRGRALDAEGDPVAHGGWIYGDTIGELRTELDSREAASIEVERRARGGYVEHRTYPSA